MKFRPFLIAAGALALASPALATELLVNGGFENAGFGGTGSYYNVGNSADHAVPADFGWSVPVNNVDIVASGAYAAPAPGGGKYGLDLVGYGSTGAISQTFGTVAGRTYNYSFQYNNNPGYAGASADVLVNNAVVASVTSNGLWRSYAGSFVGNGSPATFGFTESHGGGNAGVFLDNVSVTAVPEPATWALMIVGLGALGATMRASRRLQPVLAAA